MVAVELAFGGYARGVRSRPLSVSTSSQTLRGTHYIAFGCAVQGSMVRAHAAVRCVGSNLQRTAADLREVAIPYVKGKAV